MCPRPRTLAPKMVPEGQKKPPRLPAEVSKCLQLWSQLLAEPLILQAIFVAQPKIFEAQHPIYPLGRVASLQYGRKIWKLCFKFGMHFLNACIQFLEPASNVGGHFGCMIRGPRV